MPDLNLYLNVTQFRPRIGLDSDVATQPEIKIWFNNLVNETLVNTDPILNQYLLLLKMDTEEGVPLSFVSWDPVQRILTIQPTTALVAGAVYQITVKRELRTVDGRQMVNDRVWHLVTSGDDLGTVQPREPGDSTAWFVPPVLSWDGVVASPPTGSVTYEVQLNDNWEFAGPLTFTTTVTVVGSGGTLSTAIGVPLTTDRAFYWRVRAYTPALTGEWSATRTFWLGTSARNSSPDTIQLFEPDRTFSLVELLPEPATTHQADWPTIRATFTQALDPALITSGTFQLWYQPVDGKGGGLSLPVPPSGIVYTVVGNQVDVAIGGQPLRNTRYTILLSKSLQSASGDLLEASVTTYFTGFYKPLYGSVIGVRMGLGQLIDEATDDEVNFHLWRASLATNEFIFTRNRVLRDSVTPAELVDFIPNRDTWGMLRYAELDATVTLLENRYSSLLLESGRNNSLATFSYSSDVALLPEIRERILQLKKDRDQIGSTFLLQATVPRTSIKSRWWNRENPSLARDDAYRQVNRHRF